MVTAQQETDGEQAEQKLFARCRVDADRQRIDPRQSRAERIGILQILRRPDAELPADHVKQHHVTDVRARQAKADHAGAKKLLGAQSGQTERGAETQPVGLARAIQRLARQDGDDHEQREQNSSSQSPTPIWPSTKLE